MSKQPPPTRSESKAAQTNAVAREIIDRKAAHKEEKTARLRDERLKREAALDEALKESFPASDPVEIGHGEHPGGNKVTATEEAAKRKPVRNR